MLAKFRENQRQAILTSIAEDFGTGVHMHATGTGKSWIALQLLDSFHEMHPQDNVMWICEQKSILLDQFDKHVLQQKGFHKTLKHFLVYDYTSQKPSDWTQHVNANRFWPKPALLIINRAFLTSQLHYHALQLPISLILHDECHSITNATTQAFYTWALKTFPFVRCIGFSATPILHIQPYTRLISKYSIYDSVCDGVIVPPTILWFTSSDPLSDTDYAHIVKYHLDKCPYGKCVVWCGMITHAQSLAKLFAPIFPTYTIDIDTSMSGEQGYRRFYDAKERAILFCAAKHREGSDIPNLDACVFMDRVEHRSHKVFVQCIGRVLRLDKEGKKHGGLILDCKAKSSITICNRLNNYLNDSDSSHTVFPWAYTSSYERAENVSQWYHQNTLQLIPNAPPPEKRHLLDPSTCAVMTLKDLSAKFVRSYPQDNPIYMERLTQEFALFVEKALLHHVLQAVDILTLIDYIPHVTRGSCGSSLLCYLLGISNTDPIKHNITFARFLNIYRTTLPDIDFDFPHRLRDEVFLKLQIKYPGQIARISNHNYYHEKSAQREALRRMGLRGVYSRDDIPRLISGFSQEQKDTFTKHVEELEDTFRYYSLHCGGIVFFPDGVPSHLLHKTKEVSVLRQITCNKAQISTEQVFKVDILSSRALSQLHEACGYTTPDFDAYPSDEKTIQLFASGQNIGLTLAESPLMRKALIKFRPQSVEDVAKCLAIIRPAAKDARDLPTFTKDAIIFDDDAIQTFVGLGFTPDEGDKWRRAFASASTKQVQRKVESEFIKACNNKEAAKACVKTCRQLRKYSFCKSHAMSYAQLVWQLAYVKAHDPIAFWRATLHHAQSSYRRWVHLSEAWSDGVKVDMFSQVKDKSIHSLARQAKLLSYDPYKQLQMYGCWDFSRCDFPENCGFVINKEDPTKCAFRGILACSRRISKHRVVAMIGVAPKQYIELVLQGRDKWLHKHHVGVDGRGKILHRSDEWCEVMSDEFVYF